MKFFYLPLTFQHSVTKESVNLAATDIHITTLSNQKFIHSVIIFLNGNNGFSKGVMYSLEEIP